VDVGAAQRGSGGGSGVDQVESAEKSGDADPVDLEPDGEPMA
jgi:hypothetical protein